MPLAVKHTCAGAGMTFEESLNQHLAALHTALLQEHQKFVAQFADSDACKVDVFAISHASQPAQKEEACGSNWDVPHLELPESFDSGSPSRASLALKGKKLPPSPPMPPSPPVLKQSFSELSQISMQSQISKKTAQIFGAYSYTAAKRFSEMADQHNGPSSEEIHSGWPDLMGGKLKHPRQLMASDIILELLFDSILISNVVLMGFQAGSTWHGWFTVDCVYAILFILEIIFRLGMHGFSVFKPRRPEFKWMLFDVALASLSVFDIIVSALNSASDSENSNFTWIRIARLVRMARILRLLKLDFLKDFVLVVDGAIGGLRTLAWSMLIILLPLYVFALFLTEMIGSQGPDANDEVVQLFGNVGVSMFTGFRCLVEGDCSTMSGTPIFPLIVSKYGWMYGLLYSLMTIFMNFGLFNVIVAIYVENTMNAAKSNEVLQRQRRVEDESRFAEKLLNLIHFLWNEQNQVNEEKDFVLDRALRMHIDGDQFKSLVERPEMRDLLGELDVPKEDHKDLFEICDADGSGYVSMRELVAGVRRLRGEPRRSDLVYVMLRINRLLADAPGHSGASSPDSQRKRPMDGQMSLVSQHMSPLSQGALIHRHQWPRPIPL